MTRFIVISGMALLAASPAWAGALDVPEIDGGYALTAGAIVMGIAVIVYEKFFSK